MNKLKFPLLFLFASSILNSQDLDDSFLASLPVDLRKDVVERAENQDSNTEENYTPYKYSSKLQRAEELIDLKNRLESDLEELERRLNSDEKLDIDKELKLFGESFFSTFQTSFMPINEPNPDSSYTLDVGDVLNIQLIGQQNYNKNFVIKGSGAINLDNIGEIIIAGLSLSEASLLIKSKVNLALIGTEAFISLERIRDVNILVTGNAENAGIYTLNGNSNILHAITAAGGISEYGSFREINLLRDNKVIETLDIYDLLIDGNYNLKKRLRSGDVVFVQPRKNIVTIDGAVKRPARYEVLNNQFLGDVVRYANDTSS